MGKIQRDLFITMAEEGTFLDILRQKKSGQGKGTNPIQKASEQD
jgi:hypothetical protein